MKTENGRLGMTQESHELWQAGGLLLLYLLLSRVGKLLAATLGEAGMPLLAQYLPLFLSYFLPFCLYLQMTRGQDRGFYILPTARDGRDVLPLLPLFLAAVIATAYASAALMDVLGLPATGGGVRGDGFFPDLLANCLVPALFEELFFRGAILSLLFRRQGTGAIWVSALLFAFAHGSLYQLPYALVGGLFLALVAVIGRSWMWAFLFHFINNLLSLSLQYSEGLGENAWIPAPVLYAAVALGAVGALVYLLCRRDAAARTGLITLVAEPRKKGACVARAVFVSPLTPLFAVMLFFILRRLW